MLNRARFPSSIRQLRLNGAFCALSWDRAVSNYRYHVERAFAQLVSPLVVVAGFEVAQAAYREFSKVPRWCVIPSAVARMARSYDLVEVIPHCFRGGANQRFDHPTGWVLFVSEAVPEEERLQKVQAAVGVLLLDPPGWLDTYQGYWSRFNNLPGD
jgi:hypothetical protein